MKILNLILILLALTLIGTVGYHMIEGWTVIESLYMTTITLTTVGFSEVRPLSDAGRVFTVLFLVLGLGVFQFGIVQLGEAVVQLELRNWFGRKKMDNAIKALEDHIIVCGFGRFGRGLCEQLTAQGRRFVVIESDRVALEACEQAGWMCVAGDATDDDALHIAGIERACGLASCLDNDAENLYLVLSARLIRSDLLILSRASSDKDAKKLRSAGANRVVNVHATAATKMAQILANPHVEDFMELFHASGKVLDLAELHVTEDADYVGRSISAAGLVDPAVSIIAIRRAAGDLVMSPRPDDVLSVGDTLVAFGESAAVKRLLARG